MLSRLPRSLALIAAFALGFIFANTTLPTVVVDTAKAARMSWAAARHVSGSTGTIYVLVAGVLLGQGCFLLARGIWRRLSDTQARGRRSAAAAPWDAIVGLPNRFGVHQHLEACVRWAREDPTVRMQSLALFRVDHLDQLNRKAGAHKGTALLQRVGSEFRSASLPENASRIREFVTRVLPDRRTYVVQAVPAARYPGRWSGSTFALVFRSLDERQALAVVADVAAWMRNELHAVDSVLQLTVSFVIGCPNVSAAALEAAASQGLRAAEPNVVCVAGDETDARLAAIAQIPDIKVLHLQLARDSDDAGGGATEHSDFLGSIATWLRTWGWVLACFITAGLVTVAGATRETRADIVRVYPWPDDLADVPVVDATGAKRVKLVRRHLTDEANSRWRLSSAIITQAEQFDARFRMAQIHVDVTNLSSSRRFVSLFDFSATDAAQGRLDFEPRYILNLAQPLDGKWLAPGETWSAWLQLPRRFAPITTLVFEPDTDTHLVASPRNQG